MNHTKLRRRNPQSTRTPTKCQSSARPYTPRTNGKAERFIQTSLREWAYAHAVHSSNERAHAMPAWLCYSNSRRPHSALGGKPPISRLPGNNLLGNDT